MGIPELEKEEIKRKIDEALSRQKKSGMKCPVCENKAFTLIDGFVNTSLQDNLNSGLRIGGPSLPSAAVACNNCGNTLFFNMGVLGLLLGDRDGKK